MATVSPATVVSVQALQARIVENGAGTYTADFKLPINATLVDIIVEARALWAAATSATLIVGDVDDDDGWFTAVNLKATDLLAGQSIRLSGNLATAGGKIGAYGNLDTNTQFSVGSGAAARTVTAKVTSVGAGATGNTVVTVLYAVGAPTVITQ